MSARQCQRCLYTTAHPFGLVLDEDGLCSGCSTHEEKQNLDWVERAKLLRDRLPGWLGKSKGRDYDCVVPVRGTPEYFKVLDIVKNELGLNPLVVAYNSQFNSQAGIENFDLLRDTFDVDVLHYTSNPLVYRKLIRESLARFRSVRWPFLAGETQLPVRVAADKGIPLVIWPLHQPTEQVGAHSYREEPEMTRRGRHQYDLLGHEPAEMITVESLVQPCDVEDLEYPSNRELDRHRIRGIYLSNYYPWDSRRYSEEMIAHHGARSAKNRRTFDTYDRIDDMTYMTVHDMLKFSNLGYSRVTDSLCREIRFGRITKADALVIERYCQSEIPLAEIGFFCDWLGIQTSGFRWLCDRANGQAEPPVLTSAPTPTLDARQLSFIESFQADSSPVWEGKYIVYGKGLAA